MMSVSPLWAITCSTADATRQGVQPIWQQLALFEISRQVANKGALSGVSAKLLGLDLPVFHSSRQVPGWNITNICSRSQVNTAVSPTGTSLQLHGAPQRQPSDRLGPALSPPAPRGQGWPEGLCSIKSTGDCFAISRCNSETPLVSRLVLRFSSLTISSPQRISS